MDNKVNRCNKCGAWVYGIVSCGYCHRSALEAVGKGVKD